MMPNRPFGRAAGDDTGAARLPPRRVEPVAERTAWLLSSAAALIMAMTRCVPALDWFAVPLMQRHRLQQTRYSIGALQDVQAIEMPGRFDIRRSSTVAVVGSERPDAVHDGAWRQGWACFGQATLIRVMAGPRETRRDRRRCRTRRRVSVVFLQSGNALARPVGNSGGSGTGRGRSVGITCWPDVPVSACAMKARRERGSGRAVAAGVAPLEGNRDRPSRRRGPTGELAVCDGGLMRQPVNCGCALVARAGTAVAVAAVPQRMRRRHG